MRLSPSPFSRNINKARFFFGVLSVMWGLAFLRYIGSWVFFPWFPNVLDVIGMVAVGGFIFFELITDVKKG